MKKLFVLLIVFGVIGNDVLPAAPLRRSTRIAQMVARRQAAGLPIDEPMVTQAAAEEKKRKRQEDVSGLDWAELSAAARQRRGDVDPAAVEHAVSVPAVPVVVHCDRCEQDVAVAEYPAHRHEIFGQYACANSECALCYQPLVGVDLQENLYATLKCIEPCKHVFHKDCLKAQRTAGFHCSLCNERLMSTNKEFARNVFAAVATGNEECVGELLSKIKSTQDLVAVMTQIPNVLHEAVAKKYYGVVRLLLQAHSPKARAEFVQRTEPIHVLTPLHYAADRGCPEIAELLLGAVPFGQGYTYVCKKNRHGITALHFAAASPGGKGEAVVRLMLRVAGDNAAAFASMRDPLELNALHLAVQAQNVLIVKHLLAAGGSRLAFQPDGRGSTPLHIAVNFEQKEIIDVLLGCVNDIDRSALVQKANNEGWSSLHMAAFKKGYSTLCDEEVIKKLLAAVLPEERFAFVQQVDGTGQTALHVAAGCGNVEGLVAILCFFSPEIQNVLVSEREMSGRNVYDVAAINNFPDLQAAVESKLRENE